MNSEDASQIWKEAMRLRMARTDKQMELMEEYDRQVYYPALKALIARCEALGHSKNRRMHYNGLGHLHEYCEYCGSCVKTTDVDNNE